MILKKECRSCHRELEATTEFFYKHNISPDGLEYSCKDCRNMKRRKKTEAYEKDVDKLITSAKSSSKVDPKSRNKKFATAIWKELSRFKSFKRGVKMKPTIDIVTSILDACITIEYTASMGTKEVMAYNKGEMRKDLIKQIKNGNSSAAKILAELDGMFSKSDEYVLVPLHYTELPNKTPDDIMEIYHDEP